MKRAQKRSCDVCWACVEDEKKARTVAASKVSKVPGVVQSTGKLWYPAEKCQAGNCATDYGVCLGMIDVM